MTLWEQWRPWIRQQRSLLRELILMLLAMLVVGVYFLEHFSARLEQERKIQLQALAEQTARRAAEALNLEIECKNESPQPNWLGLHQKWPMQHSIFETLAHVLLI